MMLSHSIPPAQIFVADANSAITSAVSYMQKIFCTHDGCDACNLCHRIQKQQFHAITWLKPEKQYVLDDLEIIFRTASYALAATNIHFFIIESAELLTSACSNSLLKIVEEPPTGYHFIFLTNRPQMLLPTIRSRCTMHQLTTSGYQEDSWQLSNCFKDIESLSPTAFLKLLDQESPSEQESALIIDELLTFWIKRQRQALLDGNNDMLNFAHKIITHLQESLHELPMPGSSRLFWRNFYLKINTPNLI